MLSVTQPDPVQPAEAIYTIMLAVDFFDASTTSVHLTCPEDVTGVERIILAAQGDLALLRLLSAFFATGISIEHEYLRTEPAHVEPALHERVVTQTRKVHLVCASRTVCVTTSTVTFPSFERKDLVLDDKAFVSQLFDRFRHTPKYSLLGIGTQVVDGRKVLRKTYTLEAGGFLCKTVEEFPDRDMFVHGNALLKDMRPRIDGGLVPSLTPNATRSAEAATSEHFFSFTPHSPFLTPTLSTILMKQAADPLVGQRTFATYPDPSTISSQEPSYVDISYADFARVVYHEASDLYHQLSPIVTSQQVDAAYASPSEAPVIALLGDSGFYFATIVMALLQLNVTVFLLAPSNSEAALAHLLTTCHVSVLIHEHGYSTVARNAAAKCLVPTFAIDAISKASELFDLAPSLPPVKLNDIQRHILHHSPPAIPVIVHSSGSTSYPKPVRWSNKSFLSNGQVLLTSGGWSTFTNRDNRFLCLGPLFHTMGLTIGLAGTICAGTTLVLPLTQLWPPSPADIVRSLRSTKVTTCIIVPLLLEQLVDALESDVSRVVSERFLPLVELKLLITGGAHCPEKLAKHLISLGVNLKCIYGSSETGNLMIGSHTRPSSLDESSWNLLRPFPHTSIIFKPIESPEVNTHQGALFQVHMAANDVRLAVGVLKPGAETWNTGDVVQESSPGSGWYRLLYRDDDILVHVSGEKTNPVPMELSCRSHKLIHRIAIIGHRRPVTAAIVQLNETEAQQYTEGERLSIVREAIQSANQGAPRHSRVVEDMVLILPLGYRKQISSTTKGNCIRPKVLQTFAEEIDALYRSFEGDDVALDHAPQGPVISLAEVQAEVTSILSSIIENPVIPMDPARSLFDIGLDSITTQQLRNRLSKAFGMNLPQQFVYQNFSLEKLCFALHDRLSSCSQMAEAGPSRGEILYEILERQLDALRRSADSVLSSRSNSHDTEMPTGQVVAVVGAAGSLGIWQVKALLDRADVRQVLCLVRGTDVSAVYDKVQAAFRKAALHDFAHQTEEWRDRQLSQAGVPVVDLDQRLVVLPFDMANPHFEEREYLALASTLTTIVHTGWKMDFNQVVEDFEKDCLAGTVQLLLLAGSVRPKRFYFISSIGVVMESTQTPVLEELLPWSKDDHISASPHGYSESKFVGEYLVQAASAILHIPCSIARVGQITGDTISGVWKVQEMNPVIIAGSARIGKFPVVPDALLDWTPVDTVASSTVELALGPQAPDTVSVHHIANRSLSTYADMAQHLRAAGVDVVPTSPEEWWAAIKADEGNPCLAIEAYIETAFVQAHADMAKTGGKTLTLDISQTLRLAPNSLAHCPPLDGALWQKYVRYWRQIGFLQK